VAAPSETQRSMYFQKIYHLKHYNCSQTAQAEEETTSTTFEASPVIITVVELTTTQLATTLKTMVSESPSTKTTAATTASTTTSTSTSTTTTLTTANSKAFNSVHVLQV